MKKSTSYTLVVAYMAVIFCLSSIPLTFPEVIDRADPTKFGLHVVEYSLLGFLLFNANRNVKVSVLIGSIYGLSDEVHQKFVPFRQFSLFDVVADVIGVCIGTAFFLHLTKRKATVPA
jgi:VanZ family protein